MVEHPEIKKDKTETRLTLGWVFSSIIVFMFLIFIMVELVTISVVPVTINSTETLFIILIAAFLINTATGLIVWGKNKNKEAKDEEKILYGNVVSVASILIALVLFFIPLTLGANQILPNSAQTLLNEFISLTKISFWRFLTLIGLIISSMALRFVSTQLESMKCKGGLLKAAWILVLMAIVLEFQLIFVYAATGIIL